MTSEKVIYLKKVVYFVLRKMDQSTKINLIGCDTIVNSPSPSLLLQQLQPHELQLFFLGAVALPGNNLLEDEEVYQHELH